LANDLRPLSLGELLDRSFSLYRKNFLLFTGIVALPHLVLLAFQFAGIGLRMSRGTASAAAGVAMMLATLVLTLGVTATSQGATVIAVSQTHLNRSTSIAESFAGIKGRILYLALIMIGYGIGVGIGFLLLIIPGIILGLMWALTIPVAVIEDKGLRDSVNRSAELTKGARGRVFVIYLLFAVLIYAVYTVFMLPVLFVIGINARSHPMLGVPIWMQIAIPVASFLSQCLAGPLMTIGLSLLYYDQRVRKEAFDLQHMMATLDGTALDGTVPAVGV
jgi:glycerophosphoryl diester phosphodiesterase family protein